MGTIFGILQRDGKSADLAQLEAMAAALAHRVAHRTWLWSKEFCAIGSRLLFRSPGAELEGSPAQTGAYAYVSASDARIDNRDELVARFALGTDIQCDNDLILALYKATGAECVKHLIGAFAFAIFDTERKEIFCARDPFGEKPFAYFLSADRFAFASEPQALVASGIASARLNDERIADLLLRHPHGKTATIYEQIVRLPPAHTLTVGLKDSHVAPYWEPKLPAEPIHATDDEINARFRALLTEAVACRVKTTTPVGSFLSGGLDSSAVTMLARDALAKQRPGEPLHSFSAIFPDVPESDERPWIRLVEQEQGDNLSPLHPHWLRADLTGPIDHAASLVDCLDEPVLTPNLFKTWALAVAARAENVGVMLTGHDGDTVVSHGFVWLTELALAEDWEGLDRELTSISALLENYEWVRPAFLRDYILPLLPYLRDRLSWVRLSRLAKVLRARFGVSRKEIAKAVAPNGFLRLKRALYRGREAAGMAEIAPGFRSSRALRKRQAMIKRSFATSTGEAHLNGILSPLITESFELFDRIGARLGVEMRHPFFDTRLVEFCLSLPRDQKVRNGWTRFVMRNALGGVLPEAIRWRRDKSNLSHNFARSLLKDIEKIRGTLASAPETHAQYWDAAALDRLALRYSRTRTTSDAITLHLAYTHALWAQKLSLK